MSVPPHLVDVTNNALPNLEPHCLTIVLPLPLYVSLLRFLSLQDNAVREGLKKLFNWPTYPQLYVRGELVGGLDVMKDMAENGELKDLLAEATQKAAA